VRLYMSMSVDGYITGPDDRPGQELGRDATHLRYRIVQQEGNQP
jgi:hypothetical protein